MSPSRLSKKSAKASFNVEAVTRALLQNWALPPLGDGADKEDRGRAVVIGGSPAMPGAVVLAGMSVLRVGAGKLQIATVREAAPWVAMSVPESMVISLKQGPKGEPLSEELADLKSLVERAQAVLIGPGMVEGKCGLTSFIRKIVEISSHPIFIFDAEALKSLRDRPKFLSALKGRAIITPHAGEMADMVGATKARVLAGPAQFAFEYARNSGLVTVLKGSETFIADPRGKVYLNRAGNLGLGTCGSGDCLAGVIAGLAARGASPIQAAVWGVHLHALAGEQLARRQGTLGYLARELPAEFPRLLQRLSA